MFGVKLVTCRTHYREPEWWKATVAVRLTKLWLQPTVLRGTRTYPHTHTQSQKTASPCISSIIFEAQLHIIFTSATACAVPHTAFGSAGP